VLRERCHAARYEANIDDSKIGKWASLGERYGAWCWLVKHYGAGWWSTTVPVWCMRYGAWSWCMRYSGM
jgi:hypothetical protein